VRSEPHRLTAHASASRTRALEATLLDTARIRELIRRGMADNPSVVRDDQTGRDREGAIAGLIGVLNRATAGQVDPQLAHRLVIAELNTRQR